MLTSARGGEVVHEEDLVAYPQGQKSEKRTKHQSTNDQSVRRKGEAFNYLGRNNMG
jgi:hypothetical protein